MNAYNPDTGVTIEISEYGFEMLQRKGWIRAKDQSPLTPIIPDQPLPLAPMVNMAEEMAKRKQELEEQRAAKQTQSVDLIDRISPFPSSTLTEAPTEANNAGEFQKFPDSDQEKGPKMSISKKPVTRRATKPKAAPGNEGSKKQTTKK